MHHYDAIAIPRHKVVGMTLSYEDISAKGH